MIDRTKLIEKLAESEEANLDEKHLFWFTVGAECALAHADKEIAAAYEKGHAQGARFGKCYGREAAIADAELRGYERGKAEANRWWAEMWQAYCGAIGPDDNGELAQLLDAKAKEVLG